MNKNYAYFLVRSAKKYVFWCARRILVVVVHVRRETKEAESRGSRLTPS